MARCAVCGGWPGSSEHLLHLERDHRKWLAEHPEPDIVPHLLVSEAELAAALLRGWPGFQRWVNQWPVATYNELRSRSDAAESEAATAAHAIFAALVAAQEKGT